MQEFNLPPSLISEIMVGHVQPAHGHPCLAASRRSFCWRPKQTKTHFEKTKDVVGQHAFILSKTSDCGGRAAKEKRMCVKKNMLWRNMDLV